MKPIDHMVTSRVLAKTIKHFSTNEGWMGMREISRVINEDIKNVHTSIRRLERAGAIELRKGSGLKIDCRAAPTQIMQHLRGLSE